MKYTIYLSPVDKKKLEYEVVSQELRIHLTRLLRRRIPTVQAPDSHLLLIGIQNRLINKSRAVQGLPVYRLEADDWGEYHIAEQAWHSGEFELVFRRLSTIEFIEYLAELIEDEWFTLSEINKLLEGEKLSFRYQVQFSTQTERDEVYVTVFSVDELIEEFDEDDLAHENIRLLVTRMDLALENDDVSSVLHSSASIFETLAKDVVSIEGVQDQTLGSFFSRYRKESGLPNEILDYMLETYKSRGSQPLAGHGHLGKPTITKEQAITLSEMTKAFVKIEYKLQLEARFC